MTADNTDHNPADSPENDRAASTRSAPAPPVPPDRTIKLLLSVIAVALTLIALRPFVAPMPAHAQTTDAIAAGASGTSVAITDKAPVPGQTALVSYRTLQGQTRLATLTFRGTRWQFIDSIVLPN